MDERQLLELWNKLRNQLMFAQLAPTFLLITTVGLVAQEAQAVARDLAKVENPSHLTKGIVKNAVWLHVAKYLTPAIFIGIFVALVLALI